MIAGIHYHIPTGHGSKNKGKMTLCQNRAKDPLRGCLIMPAWWDAEGKKPVKKL